jgi:hypothetical protein
LLLKQALLAMAVVAIPSVAHAETVSPIEQNEQLVFGVSGFFAPAQNNLSTDVLGIGHYVSYTHALDWLHVGLRVALSVGMGPQYLFEPSGFIGVHFRTGRLAVRVDAGIGPLVNGGDGFSTVILDHTYAHAALQLRVVKSVIVEAFGGPGFVIGPSVGGVMAEWGVGAGWNF